MDFTLYKINYYYYYYLLSSFEYNGYSIVDAAQVMELIGQ